MWSYSALPISAWFDLNIDTSLGWFDVDLVAAGQAVSLGLQVKPTLGVASPPVQSFREGAWDPEGILGTWFDPCAYAAVGWFDRDLLTAGQQASLGILVKPTLGAALPPVQAARLGMWDYAAAKPAWFSVEIDEAVGWFSVDLLGIDVQGSATGHVDSPVLGTSLITLAAQGVGQTDSPILGVPSVSTGIKVSCSGHVDSPVLGTSLVSVKTASSGHVDSPVLGTSLVSVKTASSGQVDSPVLGLATVSDGSTVGANGTTVSPQVGVQENVVETQSLGQTVSIVLGVGTVSTEVDVLVNCSGDEVSPQVGVQESAVKTFNSGTQVSPVIGLSVVELATNTTGQTTSVVTGTPENAVKTFSTGHVVSPQVGVGEGSGPISVTVDALGYEDAPVLGISIVTVETSSSGVLVTSETGSPLVALATRGAGSHVHPTLPVVRNALVTSSGGHTSVVVPGVGTASSITFADGVGVHVSPQVGSPEVLTTLVIACSGHTVSPGVAQARVTLETQASGSTSTTQTGSSTVEVVVQGAGQVSEALPGTVALTVDINLSLTGQILIPHPGVGVIKFLSLWTTFEFEVFSVAFKTQVVCQTVSYISSATTPVPLKALAA